LDLKPPVAERAEDLSPAELKELEFAPERPAAELPAAKVPPAEPPASSSGSRVLSGCRSTSCLLLPHAIAARLRFPDLSVPIP